MSDFSISGVDEFFDGLLKKYRQGLDEALSRAASARRGASEAIGPVDPGDLIAEEPPDLAFARLVRHPSIVLVLGHRGSGKSALACRLQELTQDIAPQFAVGLPSKANRLLPEWYGLAEDPMDIPQDAIIYIPESYRLFHARASQTSQGRAIGELVNLSRHRRHTLIFDVQNPAHLDRNIISEADMVLVKEPGPLSRGFEILVTDVVMPLMGGIELARRIKRLSPNTRVLFISGYSDDVAVGEHTDGTQHGFLQKPFNPPERLRSVRSVIDGE